MQTVERMAEPEMREAMQRPDAGTIPKGASKTVKGTVIYHSPVGDIQLDWEDGAVTALKNAGADAKAGAPNELTELVFRQLDEYFAGTRKTFDFPYRVHGTPFQEAVWAALQEIPYGETRSYKDIAEAIGHPKAFRGGGHGESRQSHLHRHPLPPRHWGGRFPCGLRRRAGHETGPAGVGKGQQQADSIKLHCPCRNSLRKLPFQEFRYGPGHRKPVVGKEVVRGIGDLPEQGPPARRTAWARGRRAAAAACIGPAFRRCTGPAFLSVPGPGFPGQAPRYGPMLPAEELRRWCR